LRKEKRGDTLGGGEGRIFIRHAFLPGFFSISPLRKIKREVWREMRRRGFSLSFREVRRERTYLRGISSREYSPHSEKKKRSKEN